MNVDILVTLNGKFVVTFGGLAPYSYDTADEVCSHLKSLLLKERSVAPGQKSARDIAQATDEE